MAAINSEIYYCCYYCKSMDYALCKEMRGRYFTALRLVHKLKSPNSKLESTICLSVIHAAFHFLNWIHQFERLIFLQISIKTYD